MYIIWTCCLKHEIHPCEICKGLFIRKYYVILDDIIDKQSCGYNGNKLNSMVFSNHKRQFCWFDLHQSNSLTGNEWILTIPGNDR